MSSGNLCTSSISASVSGGFTSRPDWTHCWGTGFLEKLWWEAAAAQFHRRSSYTHKRNMQKGKKAMRTANHRESWWIVGSETFEDLLLVTGCPEGMVLEIKNERFFRPSPCGKHSQLFRRAYHIIHRSVVTYRSKLTRTRPKMTLKIIIHVSGYHCDAKLQACDVTWSWLMILIYVHVNVIPYCITLCI